jgi:hypothetical protein
MERLALHPGQPRCVRPFHPLRDRKHPRCRPSIVLAPRQMSKRLRRNVRSYRQTLAIRSPRIKSRRTRIESSAQRSGNPQRVTNYRTRYERNRI